MVRKVSGIFYLDRRELVDYLCNAYNLKWCFTRWQNGKINISFESENSKRGHFLLIPYKISNSKNVQLNKIEVDLYMLEVMKLIL